MRNYSFQKLAFFLLIMLLSVKVWAQKTDSNAYVLRGIKFPEVKPRYLSISLPEEANVRKTLLCITKACIVPPTDWARILEPPSHRYTMESQILNNTEVNFVK